MSSYDLSAWPLFRSVIDAPREDEAKQRKCFIVGPTDDPNIEVRRHAETLFKYVIRPALLDSDYSARRVDAESSDGRLTQSIVDAILDDDLVIAVLSYRNPHVFYEVALAQAAARPLILMIEDGQELTFDPRGAKVVTYSLDTDSVLSAVNVRKLQAAMREIAENDAPVIQTFRPGASALNSGGAGGATVYERSSQFTWDQRLDLMREAKLRIDMMGIANMAFALHPDAIELLRSRSGQGIEVRVLQCGPTNPGLPSLIGQRSAEGLKTVIAEIESAAETWKRIADLPELDISITLRRAMSSLPLASALLTDRAVVATSYLHTRATAQSPTLYAAAGSPFHTVMQQEFDGVWSEAVTLFRAEPRPAQRQTPANLNSARPADAPLSHSTYTPAAQHGAGSGKLRGFTAFRGGNGK
jgi:hypothetical protein